MANPTPSSPSPSSSSQAGSEQAADVIRQKIRQLYGSEPATSQEIAEASKPGIPHSKHQQFMLELSRSGKPLAEIQTAWHNYYLGLSDSQKHEVWEEFYSQHGTSIQAMNIPAGQAAATGSTPEKHPKATHQGSSPASAAQSASDIKRQLLSQVQRRNNIGAKRHAHSLLFGLAFGSLFMFVLLFSFFNERFIAPFISPSRSVSATPIIIDPSSTAVGSEPKIIIPKINVELPVVYTEPSIAEKAVQDALESGVVHYASTPNPGQKGNGVIFGHSSNNILNQGKYKFAFVLLRRLEVNDTFILQKDGIRYVYKIYARKIVKPDEVSVLNNTEKPATFTLITCDPPGTSLNRLVVIGEQISPDPAKNTASTATGNASQPAILPSNSPSLLQRIRGWFAT